MNAFKCSKTCHLSLYLCGIYNLTRVFEVIIRIDNIEISLPFQCIVKQHTLWLVLPKILLCYALSFPTLAEKAPIKLAAYIEPPFSNYEDDHFSGAFIDLAQILAQRIGRSIQFIPCPAARCLQLLTQGRADMMMGVRKTNTRETFLHYLQPPIEIQMQPLRFYINKDSQKAINTFEDLKSLSIGVLRGASYFDKFDNATQLFKVPVTNHIRLVDMLINGRFDTFLEREETIKAIVDKHIYQDKLALANLTYDQAVASYIVISKQSALMQDILMISDALTKLKQEGELQKILSVHKIN